MSDKNTNAKNKCKCKDTNTSEGPANYPREKERGWMKSNTEIDTKMQIHGRVRVRSKLKTKTF